MRACEPLLIQSGIDRLHAAPQHLDVGAIGGERRVATSGPRATAPCPGGKRDPWERPGGTNFHFVKDGIESALEQAPVAAGERDVRVAGGGAMIRKYINAGLFDEVTSALSSVPFGTGIRLFDGVDASRVGLLPVRAEPTQRVTNLTYAVRWRQLPAGGM